VKEIAEFVLACVMEKIVSRSHFMFSRAVTVCFERKKKYLDKKILDQKKKKKKKKK